MELSVWHVQIEKMSRAPGGLMLSKGRDPTVSIGLDLDRILGLFSFFLFAIFHELRVRSLDPRSNAAGAVVAWELEPAFVSSLSLPYNFNLNNIFKNYW